MKVIKIGNIYQIDTGDDIDVQDSIPVGTYNVAFAKNRGFFLVEHAPLEINERVYGDHIKKAEKVIRSFEKFTRNLGVILSGPKGIGKSIFARQVCVLANMRGYPVIIVDEYIPGIADFIASIEQECVYLFDEFEKTFAKQEDDRTSPQEQLLPLFDGVEGGKRLFVVTCNQTNQLNEYLVNRPGRFHYHFRFDYPNRDEIVEYMQDHLEPQYQDKIDDVVRFCMKTNINYDCLRAIAFELNNGESFKAAMEDLNIMDTERMYFNATLYFKNGARMFDNGVDLDMFNEDITQTLRLSSKRGETWFAQMDFNSGSCEFEIATGSYVLRAEDIQLDFDDDEDLSEEQKKFKDYTPDKVVFRRIGVKKNHFVV